LKDRYRCVMFDWRGQGQSQVTESGYDAESLTADAVAIIEELGCAPCHYIGLSMGGFVGLRLAIRHPDLLRSLILIGSSADAEPQENMGRYNLLKFVARRFGLRIVGGRVMPIMFGEKFLTDPARSEEADYWREVMVSGDRIGLTNAFEGAILRPAVYDQLHKITVPTLIIAGDDDKATPLALSQRLHAAIAGSQLVVIPDAGHTTTIEEPQVVTSAIMRFLNELEPEKTEDAGSISELTTRFR
jgi:pimeloyl-ACP methyl ester carboxylesterase